MEDRIKQLELITTRLMRRARKKHTALITPYPISNAVFGENIEGRILCYMFPCYGVVTRGMLYLAEKPKKEILLTVSLEDSSGGMSRDYYITKKETVVEIELQTVPGMRLEISIEHTDEIVTETWTSFLWTPSIKDVEAKSYLINDLENALSEE